MERKFKVTLELYDKNITGIVKAEDEAEAVKLFKFHLTKQMEVVKIEPIMDEQIEFATIEKLKNIFNIK